MNSLKILYPLRFFITVATLFLLNNSLCRTQPISFASVNVWSGLDYKGTWSIGEYESTVRREERFRILTEELRKLQPDVIALQEVNPAGSYSCRLADELGYDYISQRENAGIKIGGLGIPTNLNEGIALLAKKDLHLELVDVWDLSHSFGVFGNAVSFHFSENNIALVSKISVGSRQVYVINTHLVAAIPDDSANEQYLQKLAGNDESYTGSPAELGGRAQLRLRETKELSALIEKYCSDAPVVLLGDFNASPDSPSLHYLTGKKRYIDALKIAGRGNDVTWYPEHNANIRYSTTLSDSSHATAMEKLGARYDDTPRRIDFVLLSDRFTATSIGDGKVFLKNPQNGIFASDHYGVYAQVTLPESQKMNDTHQRSEFEGLPILSYDTDAGFGYGAKAFLLNQTGHDESLDMTLFNSTKGERWYHFVFSMPDFELRQGTVYPFAVDLTIDYDKWISNSFFGIGNRSAYGSLETYTREPLEISIAASRGFTEHSVLQAGVRYLTIRNFNLASGSTLTESRATTNSLFVEYRYDSRDSFINPSRGYVLQGDVEYAPKILLSNTSLMKSGATVQYYSTLFYPKTIFAFRTQWQTLSGGAIPVQMLLPIGGTQTLRGSPQDRFLDKTSALLNAELRFPLVWRFGGVVGMDAGKVWSNPSKIDLPRWASNPVAGLRFYMDTFVVRLDLGFGHETTGFYLNFGQLF